MSKRKCWVCSKEAVLGIQHLERDVCLSVLPIQTAMGWYWQKWEHDGCGIPKSYLTSMSTLMLR